MEQLGAAGLALRSACDIREGAECGHWGLSADDWEFEYIDDLIEFKVEVGVIRNLPVPVLLGRDCPAFRMLWSPKEAQLGAPKA